MKEREGKRMREGGERMDELGIESIDYPPQYYVCVSYRLTVRLGVRREF